MPYDDDLPADAPGAAAFLRRLAASLEAALNLAAGPAGPGGGGPGGAPGSSFGGGGPPAGGFGGGGGPPGAGGGFGGAPAGAAGAAGGGGGAGANAARRRQRVAAVGLVRALPLYGYHPEERPFVKVALFSPPDVGRAAALLQGGAVMGRRFQPYESHIPFLLQLKVGERGGGEGTFLGARSSPSGGVDAAVLWMLSPTLNISLR